MFIPRKGHPYIANPARLLVPTVVLYCVLQPVLSVLWLYISYTCCMNPISHLSICILQNTHISHNFRHCEFPLSTM